ncbi:hypothetical protein ACDF64_01055 [Agromyces sp. MMS24-JH15]|uniref:DUF4190 domain-containing protein n=1 Tax=Agromyces sp. MMS24-JH15 TaxID=3243765 RepID=UPI0037480546
MTDREGAPPTGGAPERSSDRIAGRHSAATARSAGEPSAPEPASDTPAPEPHTPEPHTPEPSTPEPSTPGAPPASAPADARFRPTLAAPDVAAGASAPGEAAPLDEASAPVDASALDEVPALDEATDDDLLAPYRPAGPTLQIDSAVFEADVSLDTGQLHSLPTGQLLIVHRPATAPDSVADEVEVETQRRVYSWIGAVVGVLGAACALFVGWMVPLSIAAIVFGVLGLRREQDGRTLAFVAIGTGVTGIVFSAVWIGYYAIVFEALPS